MALGAPGPRRIATAQAPYQPTEPSFFRQGVAEIARRSRIRIGPWTGYPKPAPDPGKLHAGQGVAHTPRVARIGPWILRGSMHPMGCTAVLLGCAGDGSGPATAADCPCCTNPHRRGICSMPVVRGQHPEPVSVSPHSPPFPRHCVGPGLNRDTALELESVGRATALRYRLGGSSR